MKTLSKLYADILVLDKNDDPVMLVEVKARRQESSFDREQIKQYLQEAAETIPYAMLVTLSTTKIFSWNRVSLSEVFQTPTADALSVYEPDFGDKTIYEYYLTTLVESWLRDVAYHWKSETPPLFDKLSEIGLAERLQNGTTTVEADM